MRNRPISIKVNDLFSPAQIVSSSEAQLGAALSSKEKVELKKRVNCIKAIAARDQARMSEFANFKTLTGKLSKAEIDYLKSETLTLPWSILDG